MRFDFNTFGYPLIRAITNIYIEKAGGGGWMPSFWSTVSGNRQLVQLLLDKGADVAVKDGEGRTALTIALKGGYTEIVELLQEARRQRITREVLMAQIDSYCRKCH